MNNILSIDLEEYYQSILTMGEEEYPRWPDRLEISTGKVLNLLSEFGIRATFFVSGYVARHYPELVHRIHKADHEIASHGFTHSLVYRMSPESFREDLIRTREALVRCLNENKILGFRAPWWSITAKCPWVWEILEQSGFRYDSSVNPIRMRFYGIPGAPLNPYQVSGTNLWEFPPATLEIMGIRLSIAGGFYWRHYPLPLILRGLRRLNNQGIPAVCYFHPWELDNEEPRIRGIPLEQQIIHYSGRKGLERKIRRILSSFHFGSFRDVFAKEKGWF